MSYQASQICYNCIGDGPPALMVHGNPATHTLWRPVAERVARERKVYMVDLPGFGGSPSPADHADFALPHLAGILLEFAELQGLSRFDLVGHSFGGAVAITLAARAPERVRSLTAITPMTHRTPPLANLLKVPFMEGIAGRVWRHAPSGFRQWFVREWTHISYGAGYSRPRAEEVAREADRPDLVPSICGLMTAADYTAYAGAILQLAGMKSMPLLLVGAGCDRVIPFAHFQHVRQRLARAACHIFPESGHVPMWQYPDELSEVILRFWGEC